MSMTVILAAAAVAVSVPILLMSLSSGRTTSVRVSRNLAANQPVTNLRQIVLSSSTTERALRPLAYGIARRVRRLTPVGVIEDIERRLELAGDPWSVERQLVAKVLLSLAVGAVGMVRFVTSPSLNHALLAIGGLIVGHMLPDVLLVRMARHRQDTIQRELPDLLDQLSVCVEAGLGFDAALSRAARSGAGPLAEEVARTLQDIQLGMPRADALRRLSERNGVSEMRQFITAVLQAESYGVPTADVLRVQAIEQREKRRFRAEARAMRLPVKLVFPLVLCILPTLLLIVLGPGLMRAIREL